MCDFLVKGPQKVSVETFDVNTDQEVFDQFSGGPSVAFVLQSLTCDQSVFLGCCYFIELFFGGNLFLFGFLTNFFISFQSKICSHFHILDVFFLNILFAMHAVAHVSSHQQIVLFKSHVSHFDSVRV